MFHLADVSGMSPMIIETVSIEVDNFNDSFLTCGTCLQLYDGSSRTPKLLTCSHTVCRSCAASIIEEAQVRDGAPSCCPICSRAFEVPPGGAGALPASFVVNQLLDLMANGRRRDVIPKCAEHITSELLFCETCDTVFCAMCDANGSEVHGPAGATASAAHTVVPFAVAIRRVSEILQFKSGQCIRNLDAASEAIEVEMHRLDDVAEHCIDSVDRIFSDLCVAIDHRKHEVVSMIEHTVTEKKQSLMKQLDIVESERACVNRECHQLPADVRSITARIGNLNERMDAVLSLCEPRENAFIVFNDSGMSALCSVVQQFGGIRLSETFPALCTLLPPDLPTTINIASKVVVCTFDNHGHRRTTGGDPVSAELTTERGERVALLQCDNGDGTYDISFTPTSSGVHVLVVKIFERVISHGIPLSFSVNAFHEPLAVYSSSLRQPIAVNIDEHDQLFVLDTGSSRIAVFDARAEMCNVTRYIVSEAMEQRGATGMWLCASRFEGNLTFVIANWRLRSVSVISSQGNVLQTFCCDLFKEPTSVAVSRNGSIFVADNAAGTVFVFAPSGSLLGTLGVRGDNPGDLGLVTSVYSSPVAEEILVCDHRVQAFSYDGKLLYCLPFGDSVGRGQYGGVTIDSGGRYIVSRSEKGRAVIQVFDSSRTWQFSIDCAPAARMRRPSGVAVDGNGHLYVADLGNSCVKKFRYI